MLFDAHASAFAALGGVPQRGIYDNMRTAVDKVLSGKKRKVNSRFEAMAGHYLFGPECWRRCDFDPHTEISLTHRGICQILTPSGFPTDCVGSV